MRCFAVLVSLAPEKNLSAHWFPRLLQTQIQYLKQVQQPRAAQLRSSMVDPAINLFFLKMKSELEQTKDKLEQAQNELSAWKFTPDR